MLMKLWMKCILIAILICIFAIDGLYLAVAYSSYLPKEVRKPFGRFCYNHLSLAPSSNEPYGVYINNPFGPTEEISVVFYDGKENHLLIFHPGGDDHRYAAKQTIYNIRVNAPNEREAVRLLREFFTKIDFKGSIRTALTFAHGAPAMPLLGRSRLGTHLFKFISEYRMKNGYTDLAFVSCNVSRGDEGRKYIQSIADEYNLRVSASSESVRWNFASKWLKSDEGKRNFDFNAEDWLTSIPHEKEPKRYSEVFTD